MAGKELDLEAFADLVGAIYEAAFEPGRWHGTLPRLIGALHGERGFLGFTSTQRGHTRSTVAAGMDPEFITRWQGEFAGADPWYDRSGALPTGTVVQGLEVVPYDDLRRTEVHAALFHRFGIDDLICASVANHGGGAFDFVTVHKSLRSGPFSQADARTMRALAPHLVRAAQLHDKLSLLSEANAARETLLDRLPYGVLLLDPGGRPLAVNREAERILAAGDGLGCVRGAIHARQPAADRRLAAAIARTCRAAQDGAADGGALLTVPREAGTRPYQVLLAPVSERPREQVFGFRRHVAAAMVVSDPDQVPEPAAATLAGLFGLTPALARLAAALAAGQTLAEYAETASITQGTARWHLKELFARTGTSRQAELVRLLLSGVAQLRGRDGGDAGPDEA